MQTIEDARYIDMGLFGILSLHWAINVALMIFWRRLRQRLIIAFTLYTIVGIIIIGRMIEVKAITVFDPNRLTSISGIVSTYAKIALGWCQIAAMLEIQN